MLIEQIFYPEHWEVENPNNIIQDCLDRQTDNCLNRQTNMERNFDLKRRPDDRWRQTQVTSGQPAGQVDRKLPGGTR